MSKFKVTGICTVNQGRLTHVHKFSLIVGGLDEESAIYNAQILAQDEAEEEAAFLPFSSFSPYFDEKADVKISEVREVPEYEVLLSLPRELAPMLPGF
jgi:ribosomal protein L20A (L18A)